MEQILEIPMPRVVEEVGQVLELTPKERNFLKNESKKAYLQ